MFTVLTVLSVHGMMINGLRRVYKSASFILSTMGAICRQWDALPTVCKQLSCHASPCAAAQMGHWGAEVVFWTDCCFGERGSWKEETEVKRPSGIWARAGSSFGKLLCFLIARHCAAQHNLLLCQLPWGRGAMRGCTGRCYRCACFLPQSVLVPISTVRIRFLAENCVSPEQHSLELTEVQQIGIPLHTGCS